MRTDEKICPQCAETIKLDARVCKHCGTTFSDESIAAEKARRSAATRKSVGIVAAIGVGLVAIIAVTGHHGSPDVASNVTAVDQDMTVDNTQAVAATPTSKPTPGSAWTYTEREDKMRGGTMKLASVTSSDTLHLSPPYGDTSPELTIRRDKKFGFDIFFTSEGQPLCRPFMSGHVSVKFDNGSVQTWGCNEAADGSSGIVFFGSAKRLLDRIKNAKTMTVEDDYFDAGRQVFTFKVEGLKW